MSLLQVDKSGPWGLASGFKDDWLVTKQAAKVFFACTIVSIALTPIFFGWANVNKLSAVSQGFWAVVGVVGTVGLLFLWLGMWRYWIRIDESRPILKRFWFVVMLLGACFGSCLYFYLVYLPQIIRKQKVVD